MFSFMSKFYLSSIASSPYFTNPSIDLFSNASDSSPISTFDQTDPPVSVPLGDPSIEESSPHPTPSPILRRSQRVREPSTRLRDFQCFSTVLSLHEPTFYKEACANPAWQKPMTEKFQALDKMHTWDLIDLPPGKSAIGCKWIYKIKTHSNGTVDRYKARLVAKGFTEEYGTNY